MSSICNELLAQKERETHKLFPQFSSQILSLLLCISFCLITQASMSCEHWAWAKKTLIRCWASLSMDLVGEDILVVLGTRLTAYSCRLSPSGSEKNDSNRVEEGVWKREPTFVHSSFPFPTLFLNLGSRRRNSITWPRGLGQDISDGRGRPGQRKWRQTF